MLYLDRSEWEKDSELARISMEAFVDALTPTDVLLLTRLWGKTSFTYAL